MMREVFRAILMKFAHYSFAPGCCAKLIIQIIQFIHRNLQKMVERIKARPGGSSENSRVWIRSVEKLWVAAAGRPALFCSRAELGRTHQQGWRGPPIAVPTVDTWFKRRKGELQLEVDIK